MLTGEASIHPWDTVLTVDTGGYTAAMVFVKDDAGSFLRKVDSMGDAIYVFGTTFAMACNTECTTLPDVGQQQEGFEWYCG